MGFWDRLKHITERVEKIWLWGSLLTSGAIPSGVSFFMGGPSFLIFALFLIGCATCLGILIYLPEIKLKWGELSLFKKRTLLSFVIFIDILIFWFFNWPMEGSKVQYIKTTHQDSGDAPVIIPPDVKIEQHSEGQNSPNVIGGDVIINPPPHPNTGILSYDFNGARRITTQQGSHVTTGKEFTSFQKIKSLHNSSQWKKLLDKTNEEIENVPSWLTPHFFKGIALANMGQITRSH